MSEEFFKVVWLIVLFSIPSSFFKTVLFAGVGTDFSPFPEELALEVFKGVGAKNIGIVPFQLFNLFNSRITL